jgi:hypothetical protein
MSIPKKLVSVHKKIANRADILPALAKNETYPKKVLIHVWSSTP